MIRKRSTPHVIQRHERDDGYYNDSGVFVHEKSKKEYVLIYSQPINNSMNDGEKGQRERQDRMAWTLERIQNKDKIEIGDYIYTVQSLRDWSGFFEFNLVRSGESSNLAEGVE